MRLGTRGSTLALAQAELVRDRLAALGEEVDLVPIRTSGDERPGGAPAPQTEDKERFVKQIEEALLAGDIDLAVHSAKDVPAQLPDGLAIVGVPERSDPRDAVCGADSIAALPEAAVVGTASLRRRAQLLAAREDLDVRETRGNVDTRLAKLAAGEYGALVLAAAGLRRLGRPEGEPVPASEMVPAAGQGCLALEARTDDPRAGELGRRLTDTAALCALTAERALVRALDATCNTPVGAFAREDDGVLCLEAFAGTPDGARWMRDSFQGDPAEPAALGETVGQRMLAAGAAELLEAAERMAPSGPRLSVY